MARVSVKAAQRTDGDEESDVDDTIDAEFEEETAESSSGERKRRRRRGSADVEIEREVTKRALIDAATRLIVVVLYMVFTLVRERDAGVVALDPEDDDLGPEDDWDE